MNAFRRHLEQSLTQLDEDGLLRRLVLPQGVDFSSNDYLGLARNPELAQRVLARLRSRDPERAIGSPASRLLRGNLEEHMDVEQRLAAYKGTEAALLFSTGYQANLGVLTALLRPDDRALSDEFNHASLIDGLRLSGARKVIYPHLDLSAIEHALSRPHPGGRTFLVTESLFSMEGDVAPLDRYADLAATYGAQLIVDDAHATGLYGPRGAGLVAQFGVTDRVEAVISTFGKALGLFGAFVGGPRVIIDWLVQKARSFVFTTAPPPLLLEAVRTAVEMAAVMESERDRVLALGERLRSRLRRDGFNCLASQGPIVPVVLGENRRALETATALRSLGFDVRAVRPPSVARGTARLRISVHAHNTEDEMDRLAEAIVEVAGAAART